MEAHTSPPSCSPLLRGNSRPYLGVIKPLLGQWLNGLNFWGLHIYRENKPFKRLKLSGSIDWLSVRAHHIFPENEIPNKMDGRVIQSALFGMVKWFFADDPRTPEVPALLPAPQPQPQAASQQDEGRGGVWCVTLGGWGFFFGRQFICFQGSIHVVFCGHFCQGFL